MTGCEPTLLADLVAFADAHRSDVVLPAVLSEGHTYTTREPVLENAVDVDPREAFLTLTPHKLFRRSYFDGLGLRFTEEKVPLEDGQLVARAYVGGGRISRCGERIGYHYMGREGTNISYEPRDPSAHGNSVATIMDSARRLPEHADEIIVDLYRRKLLRYLGPRYLPDMPADLQSGTSTRPPTSQPASSRWSWNRRSPRGPVCRRAPPGCGSQVSASPWRRPVPTIWFPPNAPTDTGSSDRCPPTTSWSCDPRCARTPPGVRVVSKAGMGPDQRTSPGVPIEGRWWPPTQTCARVADWAVKPAPSPVGTTWRCRSPTTASRGRQPPAVQRRRPGSAHRHRRVIPEIGPVQTRVTDHLPQ